MKRHAEPALRLLLLLPWLLTGCVTTTALVISEPVGPEPRVEAGSRPRGTLVVYTAWDIYPGAEPDQRYREDYVLSWPGASRVEKVGNHAGTFDEGPVSVSLPPGAYQVKARAAGHGRVTATVVIEAGRTTTLWLDGSVPGHAGAAAADQVRLPGGPVLGWRAAR